MKKCTLCNQEKDINEFYLSHERKDGHIARCKDCCKKAANDGYARKMLAKVKEEETKQTEKANKDIIARSAIKIEGEGMPVGNFVKEIMPEYFPQSMVEASMKAFDGKCVCCGSDRYVEVEPLFLEEVHTLTNSICICQECIQTRQDRSPFYMFTADQYKDIVAKMRHSIALHAVAAVNFEMKEELNLVRDDYEQDDMEIAQAGNRIDNSHVHIVHDGRSKLV